MQQVPASFYGGMDFKIDTSAYTNFMLKRQAQQAAKETSLDKYYKGLTANATEKGMRPQEQPAFQQALSNYKTFYTQNASKIANGNYPELALEAEKLSRIPFEINATSQAGFARDKNVAVIRGSNPDIAKRWTQSTWDAYNKSTKPAYIVDQNTGAVVNNPDYVDFDAMSIQLNPKEVDLSKQWEDATKDIERVETTSDEADDIDPKYTIKRTVKTTPTIKGLETAATKAAYQWNDETEYTFSKDKTFAQFKLDSPEKFNQLLASYQKIYPGKTIENDKDLYIATAISMADKEEIKPTLRIRDDVKWARDNRAANLKAWKELSAYNHSFSNAPQIQSDNNVRTYFEDIPDGTYTTTNGSKVTKKGDRWVDASGKAVTTTGGNTIKIDKANVPTQFAKNAQGKAQLVVDYIDLHVNNGVVSGGYNEFTNLVPRKVAVGEALKGTKQKPAAQQMGAPTPVTNDLGF